MAKAMLWSPVRMRGQEDVGNPDGPSPVVDCSGSEDMARQEYALSSDLRYQVQRFGVGRPFQSGEVDFDAMDLTKAFQVVEEAQQAWLRLPKVVRDRYQSWANVEAAAESGELEQLLKAAGATDGGSSGAAGASASESAPGEATNASA